MSWNCNTGCLPLEGVGLWQQQPQWQRHHFSPLTNKWMGIQDWVRHILHYICNYYPVNLNGVFFCSWLGFTRLFVFLSLTLLNSLSTCSLMQPKSLHIIMFFCYCFVTSCLYCNFVLLYNYLNKYMIRLIIIKILKNIFIS